MNTVFPSGMNQPPDIELVELCLRGNREAYGRIVERYQNLVCAMAYSACGNFARSEDIAQEVFLTAWQRLGQLRERGKFKSWLCGITRNLIHNALRRERREATASAEPLESIADTGAASPTPSEQVISEEEQTLVWNALEQIPDNYREPLVLFYRENQSIQQVAVALDLSEDAVKQRLSRGRGMLKEQVTALVEGALRHTRPGKAFVIGVLAALPALAPAAAAAAVAKAAVEGAAATKSVSLLSWAGAILGPLIGILGGYLGAKASIENTRTPRERAFMVRMSWLATGYAVLFTLVLLGVILLGVPMAAHSPGWFAGLIITVIVLYAAGLMAFIFWSNSRQRQIQLEDSACMAPIPTMNTTNPPQPAAQAAGHEYKSKATLLGLPLIHVVSGTGFGPHYRQRVAKGWIAVGDIAFGVLFAGGGIAVGGIAMGGLSLGVISFAGLALGVFAFGGLGIGVWALGGAALGIFAFGGAAVAWHAAVGGLAVAHEIAVGGGASAAHANDALARNYIESSAFFSTAKASMKYAKYVQWIWLLALLPLFMNWRARRGQQAIHHR